MKQTLLSFIFMLFTGLAFCHGDCDSCNTNDGNGKALIALLASNEPQAKIAIFPNPATDYIQVNNVNNLKEVHIFNLVGNEIMTFKGVKAGQKLNISDISSGMYLIQLVDNTNKVIATKRLSKR